MYSYITEELPKAVFAAFEQLDASRVSITGHSMGGHGALTLVGLAFQVLVAGTGVLVIGIGIEIEIAIGRHWKLWSWDWSWPADMFLLC